MHLKGCHNSLSRLDAPLLDGMNDRKPEGGRAPERSQSSVVGSSAPGPVGANNSNGHTHSYRSFVPSIHAPSFTPASETTSQVQVQQQYNVDAGPSLGRPPSTTPSLSNRG